jgi:hypothetical protein
MRWRFSDPNDAREAQARAEVEQRIDAWWSAFAGQAPRLDALFSRRERWDLPSWMHQHLGGVHPQLMWEFGVGIRGGRHRLVITPEVERHLRPLVNVVLARAPSVPGWEFYEYRLAEPVAPTLETIQARAGVDFGAFRASVRSNGDGGVDLVYWSPRRRALDKQQTFNAAFVATETLLGERVLDTFVDVIEVADRQAEGEDVDLAALATTVAGQVEAQLAQLSPAPFVERTEDSWTLWELKPADAPDYTHQRDLFVGKSALPAMWTRAHSGRPFASARFSRFGETYCYVKLDGTQGNDKEGFQDKSEIEDALDAALKPSGLGAHVGGGTGRRYSYVDLALRDVDRAIPIIRETLQRGRVPKRSWLLFFDDTLRDEWVGIWPDSPEPP